MNLQFCVVLLFEIMYTYIYIFMMNIIFEDEECWLTNISPLAIIVSVNSKGVLGLSNNQLTGTLTTERRNINELGKLLCACFLYYFMLWFANMYDNLYSFVKNIIF